ncbi:hypothetical protein HPB48_024601 [Haemaphysalis longicornis]|uniref:C2H2-type domain-containing protein n=1 Tax=Haemaphysalis longicornis TaxID=44386 RepID=A0A9J6H6K9_HAELO|nr:hypothetical protein HPB48_024601 [Haemaphysalis longicornis]
MAASDPGSDVDVDGTDELDVGSESQPQEVLATEHARLRIGAAPGAGTPSSWRSSSGSPEDELASLSPPPSLLAAGPASCSDSELSFTIGVTEATPYACHFCDKAFPRLSYLKRHEQVRHGAAAATRGCTHAWCAPRGGPNRCINGSTTPAPPSRKSSGCKHIGHFMRPLRSFGILSQQWPLLLAIWLGNFWDSARGMGTARELVSWEPFFPPLTIVSHRGSPGEWPAYKKGYKSLTRGAGLHPLSAARHKAAPRRQQTLTRPPVPREQNRARNAVTRSALTCRGPREPRPADLAAALAEVRQRNLDHLI